MNNTIKFSIKSINNGERVDVFLSNHISYLTRSNIKKLIQSKHLLINGTIIVSPSTKLKKDDQLKFNIKETSKNYLVPKKMDLNIIFEDKDLLIINKPKGLVVHPGAGNYENTLANALAYKYKNNLSNINGELRPGIVHRIDKNTSGLLVIAKNNFSHSQLGKQFSDHSIKRKYQCLVWGVLRPMHGRIESLISRSKKNRQLMTVSDIKGKRAITNYKTIKTYFSNDIPKISLIECELETGRTHQIRVHLKYKGTSLLGDYKYGEKKIKYKKVNKEFLENIKNFNGQALHAQTLSFVHPSKKEFVSFSSDLPNDFQKMLNLLNNLAV
mgnify:CR=1 FL=1